MSKNSPVIKPHLACDWAEKKQKFPVGLQPKIDGVRGMNFAGPLTGRSLKNHANINLTERYSMRVYKGLDGELAYGDIKSKSLCRDTSSVCSSIHGTGNVNWHVFDLINDHTIDLPYNERYKALQWHVDYVNSIMPNSGLFVVEMRVAHSMEQLKDIHAEFTELYEGTIVRDLFGLYKQGRCTAREGAYMRIKDFVIEEAVVTGINEGRRNNNELMVGLDGYAERSTHAENMIPNGMVGSLDCTDIKTGTPITVSSGCMTEEEALMYFNNPSLIIGKIIKYQYFPKGIKDKPRFATYQCIKTESDIG